MSNHEQYNIGILNRMLKNKPFTYEGEILSAYGSSKKPEGYATFKVDKVIDVKNKIVVGDWKPVMYVNLKIVGGDDNFVGFLERYLSVVNDDAVMRIFELFGGVALSHIRSDIREYLNSRIGFDGIINVENIKIEIEVPESLNESRMNRYAIRTIIKDIVKVLKNEGDGEYVLPEDISDNMTYDFDNGPEDITVELEIRPNKDINRFYVNGNYVKEIDVIEVLITYNPEQNLDKMMYDIIGELNDLIAHELEHYNQYTKGEFDLDNSEDDDENALHYYTKPHEIKAQIQGFKRLSKIRRIPLEPTIRNWFETHKEIHHLNDKDAETVIDTLLQNV